jgi:hypothetical protein
VFKKVLIGIISIFFLFNSSLLFAMGESVTAEKGNVAVKGSILAAGKFVSASSVIDGNFNKAAFLGKDQNVRELKILLKKPVYIDKINVYLKEAKEVSYDLFASSASQIDVLIKRAKWQEIASNNRTTEYLGGNIRKDTYDGQNFGGQFLKMIFPTGNVSLLEFEVLPSTNVNLEIFDIEVVEESNKAILSFKTNYETLIQVVYDYNYEFIYKQRLTQAMADFFYRKEHKKTISNLKPRTSYRVLIRATDYNGKMIESRYLLFTTKEQQAE